MKYLPIIATMFALLAISANADTIHTDGPVLNSVCSNCLGAQDPSDDPWLNGH